MSAFFWAISYYTNFDCIFIYVFVYSTLPRTSIRLLLRRLCYTYIHLMFSYLLIKLFLILQPAIRNLAAAALDAWYEKIGGLNPIIGNEILVTALKTENPNLRSTVGFYVFRSWKTQMVQILDYLISKHLWLFFLLFHHFISIQGLLDRVRNSHHSLLVLLYVHGLSLKSPSSIFSNNRRTVACKLDLIVKDNEGAMIWEQICKPEPLPLSKELIYFKLKMQHPCHKWIEALNSDAKSNLLYFFDRGLSKYSNSFEIYGSFLCKTNENVNVQLLGHNPIRACLDMISFNQNDTGPSTKYLCSQMVNYEASTHPCTQKYALGLPTPPTSVQASSCNTFSKYDECKEIQI